MIAGVVLAGGLSRRMGADKPLQLLRGRSLISYALDRLHTEASAVAISANADPSRFNRFGAPILQDGLFAGRGPLAGVLAGLEWAVTLGAEALLTIPADTPFVPPGIASALTPPPACATSLGRTHHLVALWPTGAAQILRAFLSSESHYGAGRFGALIGTRHVVFPAKAENDPFWNANTQADLDSMR